MQQQDPYGSQEPLNLPELFLQDPQLSGEDEALFDLGALDASESLLGSAETSQGYPEQSESGSLSDQGARPGSGGGGRVVRPPARLGTPRVVSVFMAPASKRRGSSTAHDAASYCCGGHRRAQSAE